MVQTSTLSRTNTQHCTVWNGQTVVDWLACVWTRRLHWPVWPLLPFVSSISPKWSINTSPFSCCKSLLHHKDTDLDNKRQHLITNPGGSHSTIKGIAARRYIYFHLFFVFGIVIMRLLTSPSYQSGIRGLSTIVPASPDRGGWIAASVFQTRPRPLLLLLSKFLKITYQ